MARINIFPKKLRFFNFPDITLTLILINTFFYIIMIFSQDFVLRNIAISFDNISQLKLWTFFTSMFMHAGLIHLLANMFSLFFVGGLVEKIIGKKRYFWFYILSGFFAGVFFIISELFFFSGLPAVGASGAIFGLIGLLVILTPNLPVYIMLMPIPIKMKYAGPIMLVVLWLISIFGRIPIGNMAHFGGLIVGIIYGVYLKNKYKRKTEIIRRYFS